MPAAIDGRAGGDPRGWPLTQTTARPSAAGAPSRHCTFGGYLHRHRQVARLARVAITQTAGREPGRYVRCLPLKCQRARLCRHQRGARACGSRCRCVPARRAWLPQGARRCREYLQAPIARTCARSSPQFLRRGCRLLCDHRVLPMPPVRRHVHASPMTTRCRGAGLPRSAHRMPTMLPSAAAATNARAFVLRPRCAHALGRRRRRYRHGPAPGACAIREGVFAQRRRGRGAHRCAGPALPSKR